MADTIDVVVSDTMRHVIEGKKACDAISADREQDELTRSLARKARRALNDLIATAVTQV